MILGISEDFSINVDLDAELSALPKSGEYLNTDVHPIVNLKNLLNFLPNEHFTFENYDAQVNYKPFEITRNKKNIVTSGGEVYQCIKETTGNNVDDEEFWLKTNIESLRLKTFIYKVNDKVRSDLNLSNRLIDNQYIYEVGKNEYLPNDDYFGWAIEPKNSDYVRITLNEISVQNLVSGLVDIYVVNQGVLIDTLQVEGGNGKVKFERLNYDFIGKGTFYFLIEKQKIKRDLNYVDALRYEGFVAYPVTANGDSFDDLNYKMSSSLNGIGVNISAHADSNIYIENNARHLSRFYRSVFELLSFQLFLQNPLSRSNNEQREQMNEKMIVAELKDLKSETVITRYNREIDRAFDSIKQTFDGLLGQSKEMVIKERSI